MTEVRTEVVSEGKRRRQFRLPTMFAIMLLIGISCAVVLRMEHFSSIFLVPFWLGLIGAAIVNPGWTRLLVAAMCGGIGGVAGMWLTLSSFPRPISFPAGMFLAVIIHGGGGLILGLTVGVCLDLLLRLRLAVNNPSRSRPPVA